MNVTLPHEREILAIVDLAMNAYEGPFLVLVLTDSQQHVRWLISKLHDATLWDKGRVKLFREGIETNEGGKIIIRSANHPEMLMGIRPDKIVLMGRLGELYYHLKSMDAQIEAIA